jgi:mannose-1-phosphate guanylyltransferase/mannose-6-phosphate isomerase
MMISVILAGGKGMRLWPESTPQHPKQMCDFLGQGSLLNMSLQRLRPLGSLIVVCGTEYKSWVCGEGREYDLEVLAESVGRNTAPAVGFVLSDKAINDDMTVGIFPSDHYIQDDELFRDTIIKAETLSQKGYLVTIGIQPTYAETGYGYIEREESNNFFVRAFHEKPDYLEARRYLLSGNFLWNSGIFIAKAGIWRALIAEYLPEIFYSMQQGRHYYVNSYDTLPNISIDYGIAERCKRMAVVPGDFGWSDIGSWDALAAVMNQDEKGNALTGDTIAIESSRCVGRSQGKKLVLFGVEDLVAVEAGDTILICPRNKSQDIKKLVETMGIMG